MPFVEKDDPKLTPKQLVDHLQEMAKDPTDASADPFIARLIAVLPLEKYSPIYQEVDVKPDNQVEENIGQAISYFQWAVYREIARVALTQQITSGYTQGEEVVQLIEPTEDQVDDELYATKRVMIMVEIVTDLQPVLASKIFDYIRREKRAESATAFKTPLSDSVAQQAQQMSDDQVTMADEY